MKIVVGNPPNIEEIKRVFDLEGMKPVFAYGDILYCPHGGTGVDDALMEHEKTHARYQDDIGIEEWWDRYLKDKQFRFDQELEAYQVQYRYYCKHVTKDRNRQARFLQFISEALASKMYGNIVTVAEARRLVNQ